MSELFVQLRDTFLCRPVQVDGAVFGILRTDEAEDTLEIFTFGMIYLHGETVDGTEHDTLTSSQKVYVTAQDPTSVANAQQLIQAVMDGKKLTEDEDGNVIVAPEEEVEQ